MKEKLRKALQKLDGEKTILVVSSAENIQKNMYDATEFLVKKKNLSGVYISINKPCKTIKSELIGKRKLNNKRLYFIDCISAAVSKTKKVQNVLYVSDPTNLQGISKSIKQIAQVVREDGLILVDALRTLLIYNSAQEISKFVESITSLQEKYKIRVLFMTTAGKDKKLIKKIYKYFDKVIQLR